MTLVSYQAPDFTAPAVLGNGKIINDFNFKSYIKDYETVIFFWPMDFTFVCPSELISFDRRYDEFIKRNIKIIGISCDSVFVHKAWRKLSVNNGGIGKVQFPMVSDIKREIIKSYKIEHPDIGVALRASFLIDKLGIIRHQVVNDLPLGRNIEEMIRMIDALQLYQKYGEVCPAQWKKGQKGMKPTQEGLINYISENINKL